MNPLERLEQSRALLRSAMTPAPGLTTEAQAHGIAGWLHRLRESPAIAIVLDALSGWWSKHPMRLVAEAAGDAVAATARPIAQHNPVLLVVVAALAGATLTWSRPWRWLVKPALFAGLAPQLVSRVLANLPLESWLSVFATPPAEPTRSSP